MNRIYKAFLIGAAIVALSASCSDFLEVNPRTQVSEAEFYSDEESLLKGLYAVINEAQTRLPEVWSYSSLLGDESETGGGIGEGQWKYKWDYGLYNGVIAACLLIDKLEESTSSVNPDSNHYNSWRIFRYADVLLLAVELEIRMNGSVSSQAQGWFDQIRDRAFGDKNHRINLSGKSKEELLASKGWTEKYRYFPICQSEIDKSKGGLTQNEAWL